MSNADLVARLEKAEMRIWALVALVLVSWLSNALFALSLLKAGV